jgi:hypothetical protein
MINAPRRSRYNHGMDTYGFGIAAKFLLLVIAGFAIRAIYRRWND